jgi:protein-disulfide isomerase
MKPRMTLPRAAMAIALGAAALALGSGPLLAQKRPAPQQDLANPDSAFARGQAKGNWQAMITRTERGHLIGNPKAESRMIEFISYTCPHCATFTNEGEPGLDLALISPGKMSLEVRPVIRNPIDLAVSLLAGCGEVAGFKDRHRRLMLSQGDWLEKARQAPRSQIEIWFRGDSAARINAANALGLVDMFAKAGMPRTAINACLADDKAAAKLLDNSDADRADFAFPGTPSFALDGKLINDVSDWKGLYPVLSAHFSAAKAANGDLPPRK